MENKKQTAVEWLAERCGLQELKDVIAEAKEMEKEQIGYTKEDVLMAGFIGEINHFDTKHIVSLLDEAKQYNETYEN